MSDRTHARSRQARAPRPARTPGQRAGLTRGAVLEAAGGLLAERGLEALTMRGLAARLGVAPNALYSHVASKTALVDDLLDEVLAEVATPEGQQEDPEAGLVLVMTSTYDVLLAHPDLVPLYLSRQGARGPNAERLGEVMLELLDASGVTGIAAREALRVLIVYTIGFAALATSTAVEPGATRPLEGSEVRRNFVSGLHWLLAGVLSSGER